MARALLSDEEQPLILQLGDFGLWPGTPGRDYLHALRAACAQDDVCIWFIDGNHDDPAQLEALLIRPGQSLNWLPRGHRWTWHNRTWLALGGGVSLDRIARVNGLSWWPQEEITDSQEQQVISGGHADVMITHDCPSGVIHTFAPPPHWWHLRDIARSDRHRERLQRIVTSIQPYWLMHGHLHRAYQRVCDLGYGPVEITGLDKENSTGPNYAVLDVQHMSWRT